MQNLCKNNEFWFIFGQFCHDFAFLETKFDKMLRFPQNRDFQVSEFCDHVAKFVWRAPNRNLVHLTFVTHSQTSPPEKPHSSNTISWKNDIKIHDIDHQNVETKFENRHPKIDKIFHGRHSNLKLWLKKLNEETNKYKIA